jgi:L-seryl-tRNA(Ser) seleniumtransferase
VIVEASQRSPFWNAARQAGGELVEVDGPAGLTAALSARTACVLYLAGGPFAGSGDPLEHVVHTAHAHGVPVLVDAAAQVPPVSSLWAYTRDAGADAVIVSGGKGLRGPQSSGMVLGTRAIVEGCCANGSPASGAVGRPMKVGKEEMVGLLAAVEWYLAQDEAALLAGYEATVGLLVEGLAGLPGVSAGRGYPSEAGQPHARAVVRLAPPAPARDVLVRRLAEGEPRIAVGLVGDDAIALNPQTLGPGEDAVVLARLHELLG